MGRPDQHSYADYLFRSGLPREEADRRASLAFDKKSSSNDTPARLGDKTTESIATTLAASMFGEDEHRDPDIAYKGNERTIVHVSRLLGQNQNPDTGTDTIENLGKNLQAAIELEGTQPLGINESLPNVDFTLPGD